jgi:EAL domain-containing protein (putative c-di-GMP-specific phosphodiesterase class I)
LTRALNFIGKLKPLGCLFALDDFGSGMSSFAYLKHLHVDFLKIDGSYVKGMANDPIDCAKIEAIQNISGVMGIATIAQHVEDDITLTKLKAIGINYAQGSIISPRRPFYPPAAV